MRRILRQNAVTLAVVGCAFCLFFEVTKHAPRFSAINPFAEDPYDSVGSFALQFVMFIILLSLFRSLQRQPRDSGAAAAQVRGQLMGHLAIAFTLVADLIALLRHRPVWITSRAGYELLALTACLFLWTVAAGVLLLLTTKALQLPPLRAVWLRIVVVPLIAAFILIDYPEHLRQSLAGEIFTVLCVMVLLFVIVRAIGTAFIPHTAAPAAFDIAAIGNQPDLRGSGRVINSVSGWLRGRRVRWTIVISVGVLCGAFLAFQELAGGPSPHGARRLLVIAVYLALETAGVLTGYALLAEPLGLLPRK